MKHITKIFSGIIYQTKIRSFIADSNIGLLERVVSINKDGDSEWLWRVSKRRYTGTKHFVDSGTFARRHNTSVDIFKIYD